MKHKPKCYPFLFLGVVLLLASLVAACQPSPPPPAPPVIAASSSSLSFSAEQAGPNPPSLILEIHNSGAGTLSWSAADDADWLTLSPTSGSCSTGEINNLTVALNIAGLSPGDYSATITISASEASNSPQTISVNLTITPITPTVSYEVSLAVSPVSQTGSPGDTLHYTVTITNRGTKADAYDLSISDTQAWSLTAPSTTAKIASTASESITLNLTIPQNAASQTQDEITITATSQSDPTVSDSAVCTAVVIEQEQPPPTTPASVSISPGSTTKSPGDTFQISILVDAAAYNLMGIDVEISYDGEAMTTSGAQITKHNLLGGMEIGPTVSDGKVRYALANITPQADISGSIMTIEFTIAENASGSYHLTITVADLANEDSKIIPGVVTNDGLITVQ